MDLREFEVDPSTYEGGKKVEFGDGAYVSVRSAGSERATKVRERLWKPYTTWRTVPQEVLDKLNAQWIAQGLLAEMVGFSIDGKPLALDLSKPEDQKRLADILAKPAYKGFRSRVIGISLDEANFQAAIDQAVEGNSERSPAGNSSGANTRNA